jgi:hypothetical protein
MNNVKLNDILSLCKSGYKNNEIKDNLELIAINIHIINSQKEWMNLYNGVYTLFQSCSGRIIEKEEIDKIINNSCNGDEYMIKRCKKILQPAYRNSEKEKHSNYKKRKRELDYSFNVDNNINSSNKNNKKIKNKNEKIKKENYIYNYFKKAKENNNNNNNNNT